MAETSAAGTSSTTAPAAQRRGIDPAALAAACLATAVTTLVSDGPYGPMSIPIGIAILLLIITYDVDPNRNAWQSLAYGAVIALVMVLTLGFPLECLFAQDGLARLETVIHEIPNDVSQSSVPPWAALVTWILATGVVCWFDRRRAKRSVSS